MGRQRLVGGPFLIVLSMGHLRGYRRRNVDWILGLV